MRLSAGQIARGDIQCQAACLVETCCETVLHGLSSIRETRHEHSARTVFAVRTIQQARRCVLNDKPSDAVSPVANNGNVNAYNRYANNRALLDSNQWLHLRYAIARKVIKFETDSALVARLLCERFGCFFQPNGATADYCVMVTTNGDRLRLRTSRGEPIDCRDFGEVLFPHLARLFDRIFAALSDTLVLHAASVSIGDRGLLILGHHGVGKTTLALELARRGYAFFSDDVTLISLERPPMIRPFPIGVKIVTEGESAVDESTNTTSFSIRNPCDIPYVKIGTSASVAAALIIAKNRNSERHGLCLASQEPRSFATTLRKLVIPPESRKIGLSLLETLLKDTPFVCLKTTEDVDPVELGDIVDTWFDRIAK